ncbi:membrane protein insertion efficiency factor YidD [Blochmannia endosymbiont of Polyrhachis (Hedomyrma) turneri]|uniref:membrane protein insertion efficiency factor YidD n=1 Tax=Blochmannia endosymbiont of Polyrhachis (Hedomyrma) turneri TaxID=1505596 RepID=UPI00061A83BA|nr:membrane protein insertion efficiency factor YidD [Blochmannia endosymbiont of Polyrhachis (Hedomyrma) turneri]AKC59609.1 putative membrane protein insertion efficiency factor [Blochmannia endosymbiont of Polyrhachis (Hedomyrma) turneri]
MPLLIKLLTKLIQTYQIIISPLMQPRCRFQKTCSQYGIDAINNFGALKGTWMLIIRISKCHPFVKITKFK